MARILYKQGNCVNRAEHYLMASCGWCDYVASDGRPPLPATSEVRVTDPVTGGEKGKKPEEYALLPVTFWAEVARVYGKGAEKYAPRNWEKGYAWSLSYSAAMRHLTAFWGGEETDPETGLSHLAHAAFHLGSLFVFEKKGLGTDDRA